MKRTLTLALLASATLFPACSDMGPGSDDLERQIATQRAIWKAYRPATYTFDVERLCFCAEEARGPVRVSVAGEQVRARTYLGDGSPVDASYHDLFPSVDGLFDILEEAVRGGAHQIQVTWDPVTGAPLDFWVDYEANLADEEQGYRLVAAPRAGG